MNPRRILIAMSALAVIGDSMLVPFYPLFFAARFNVTAPAATGLYLAAVCATVMVALPIWVRVARRVHPVRLLVVTLPAAAALSSASAFAPDFVTFWIVSLAMIACKASYLLMYPYALALGGQEEHAGTIGMLAVVLHFGAIFGALIGGATLQVLEARDVFLIMALSDLAQMVLCLTLLRAKVAPIVEGPPEASIPIVEAPIVRLLATMAVFYFGAFLVRPFFATRWAEISSVESPLVGGAVFAVPAAAALLGLAINRRRRVAAADLHRTLPLTLGLGAAGLLVQALPSVSAIILGRCLYGWSMFQATVALDALLFAASRPERYALDFSKANFVQNFGVVMAALMASGLVATCGQAAPFLVAAAAFAITLVFAPRSSARSLQLLSPSP